MVAAAAVAVAGGAAVSPVLVEAATATMEVAEAISKEEDTRGPAAAAISKADEALAISKAAEALAEAAGEHANPADLLGLLLAGKQGSDRVQRRLFAACPTLLSRRCNGPPHCSPVACRSAHRQQETSWREVARADLQDERPRWVLTCYAHEREAPNDLAGDISPEEVWWANMQAAQRGLPGAQLAAEFKAAEQARAQLFNQLLRASKPPSLGGPDLEPPSATISGLQDAAPAVAVPGGFSTSVGGFGGQPATQGFGSQPAGQPAQPVAAFGQAGFGQAAQPTGGFGQLVQPAAGFGHQPALAGGGQQQPAAAVAGGGFGFGGAFGAVNASKPVSGQHKPATGFASTPFRQPAGQAAFGSTPFGHQAPAGALAAPAGSPFGGGSRGGTFGQPALAVSPGMAAATPGQEQTGVAASSAGAGAGEMDSVQAAAWTAANFEKGNIPEQAPPPMFCH